MYKKLNTFLFSAVLTTTGLNQSYMQQNNLYSVDRPYTQQFSNTIPQQQTQTDYILLHGSYGTHGSTYVIWDQNKGQSLYCKPSSSYTYCY
jgi:hypothetical protein